MGGLIGLTLDLILILVLVLVLVLILTLFLILILSSVPRLWRSRTSSRSTLA